MEENKPSLSTKWRLGQRQAEWRDTELLDPEDRADWEEYMSKLRDATPGSEEEQTAKIYLEALRHEFAKKYGQTKTEEE